MELNEQYDYLLCANLYIFDVYVSLWILQVKQMTVVHLISIYLSSG